jgi:hypothetical protein
MLIPLESQVVANILAELEAYTKVLAVEEAMGTISTIRQGVEDYKRTN